MLPFDLHKFVLLLLGLVFTAAQDMSAQQPESAARSRMSRAQAEPDILLDSAETKLEEDLPAAFGYLEQALENSISTGDRGGEARSYLVLARTHYGLEQYDLASDYYRKALTNSSFLDDLELLQAYQGLGLSLEQENNITGAVNQLVLALSYAMEYGLVQEEINIRYDLARIYAASHQSEKALQEYATIRNIEEQRNNKKGVANVSNSKGEIYLQQNKPEAAISSYGEAERIADETDDVELKSAALQNKANAYRKSRRFKEELEVRQQSLEIHKESNLEDAEAEDNLMIGEIYLETQQPAAAVPYIERSIALSSETGDIEKKSSALKKLSEAYGQQGAYDKALISYQEYAETIDSLYARRERKLQQNLELVASVSQKIQRIDLLEQDYELTKKTLTLLEKEQTISVRELRIQKWITGSLVLLVFGLGLATFLIYRSSVEKRKANLLLALRSLRSQMNPHFIFNSLNSVNSYIAANDERMANKYLSEFSRLMRLVLENSKHDFVPVASELEVIRLYLKLEHSRFSEKFDYNLEIDEGLDHSDLSMPPMLIQPYIENAIWHGLRYREEKGNLTVQLSLKENILLARIEDNGIGRRKSAELKTRHQQQNSATGMKNTRSRLELINEVYTMKYTVQIDDLDSVTGTGTVVKLQIPLQSADHVQQPLNS